jgi:23S rRNA pseudouridine1911/1915/1917 synthase
VEKEYLAIVHGEVAESEGVIEAALGKDEQSRVAVKDCVRRDGLAARTEFKVERRFQYSVFSNQYSDPGQSAGDEPRIEGAFSLLRVRLRTGRKHQIRIHLAHIGHPVVGDKLYGGDEDLYLALVENRLTPEQWRRLILPHQALHANRVRFERRGKEAVFSAEPEEWFVSFLKEKP